MTVRELIEKLQTLEPDAEVEITSDDGLGSRTLGRVFVNDGGCVEIGDGWEGL